MTVHNLSQKLSFINIKRKEDRDGGTFMISIPLTCFMLFIMHRKFRFLSPTHRRKTFRDYIVRENVILRIIVVEDNEIGIQGPKMLFIEEKETTNIAPREYIGK